jgi:hypothetical protein
MIDPIVVAVGERARNGRHVHVRKEPAREQIVDARAPRRRVEHLLRPVVVEDLVRSARSCWPSQHVRERDGRRSRGRGAVLVDVTAGVAAGRAEDARVRDPRHETTEPAGRAGLRDAQACAGPK